MEQNFINDQEKKAVEILSKIDQQHLYENLSSFSTEERQKFAEQVDLIHSKLIIGSKTRRNISRWSSKLLQECS